MTFGTVIVASLVVLAAAFVLAPLFRKDEAQQERRATRISEEEELLSQREMALGALRDLEDDRATGKIGEKDYEEFKTRLTAQAVAILKRLDELGANRANPRPEPVPPARPRAT